MQRIAPFLRLDDQAEEAVNLDVDLFPDAHVDSIRRWPEGTPDAGKVTPVRRRALLTAVAALALLPLLAGCFLVGGDASFHGKKAHIAVGEGRGRSSASSTPTPSEDARGATPTPTPVVPVPTASRPATAEPQATPVPAPYLTAIAAGTVVSEGDVASPKGSIHFHFRVVANGDNTYSVQYSGFTSTVPVPISVTLLDTTPQVGDGLTFHGVGDHQLGGPTTAAAPTSTASLGAIGQPSYLTTMVTYSSAPSATGVPTELGPNKVLAVTRMPWGIPVRQTNVHPVDGGSQAYATGTVTGTTASGAPRGYVVAPGDILAEVAARFGISTQDLIWLNANLQVFGSQQYLFSGTTLNLDPDDL